MDFRYRIKRKIKFLYQKITRGFSDDELWCLDDTIARFVAPRLERFIKINGGYPPGYEADGDDGAGWDRDLRSLAETMKFLGSDEKYENIDEELWAKVDKDLEFFGKYFNHLWY